MGKKLDIKERAKGLYIEYDGEGKKTYSLRDISKILMNEGYKRVTHQTIKRWSEKPDKVTGETWNMLNSKIKAYSIQKAKGDKLSTEETVIEAKSDSLSQDFKKADKLMESAFNVLVKDGALSTRDAVTLFKYAMDIKMRIADLPENKKENKIAQVFKIGDQEISF